MSVQSSSRLVFAFLLTILLGTFTLADTIRLKDGSTIKGHIASFSGGVFTVEIGEGARRKQLTFSASEIESITFDTHTSQTAVPTSTPVAYVKPQARNEQAITNPPATVKPPPQTNSATASSKMGAIKWSKRVAADNSSNGWTNTGWVVRKGQRVRITGDGNVSLGKGRTSSPSGIPELDDAQKLLKSVPTGALIAVVGDDNNDFIYIGAEREFTAARDGALFLGVNEGDLNDNSGAFDVTIEILPESVT